MKDTEFIELLNLYLDHEISAADAVRLEAEVLANPQRRRIYQDYCRIQKGCRLLAQEFQTEATPATAGNVVAFEAAPVRRSRYYVAGGLAAAAACLAIGFMAWNRPPGADAQNQLAGNATVIAAENQVAIAPALMTTERTIGPTVTLAAKRDESQSPIASGLRLDASAAARGDLFGITATARTPQFDWMHAVQFTPIKRIPIEDFRFDARPTFSPTRTGPQSLRDTTVEEMNALRFQR